MVVQLNKAFSRSIIGKLYRNPLILFMQKLLSQEYLDMLVCIKLTRYEYRIFWATSVKFGGKTKIMYT